MQPYAIRFKNFMRFGEKDNSIVFDISEDEQIRIDNGEISYDDLYDEIVANPLPHYKKVHEKLSNLIAICGVVGDNRDRSNGVGKSTVFEGICYVLYDQIVRKNVNTTKIEKAGASVVTRFNNELPKGLSESYVEMIFEERGILYRIKRGRTYTKTQKSSNPVVELHRYNEKGSESESGHRTGDVNELILKCIGHDFDVFNNGAMFGQNDSGKFLSGTDKVRKEIITSLLKLDSILKRCLDEIRNRKNSLNSEIEKLRGKLDVLMKEIDGKGTVEELTAKALELGKQVVQIEKSIKERRSEIEKLSGSEVVKEANRVKEEGLKLKEQIQKMEKEKDDQKAEWETMREEESKRKVRLIKQKDAIEDKLKKLDDKEKQATVSTSSFDETKYKEYFEKLPKAQEYEKKALKGLEVVDERNKKIHEDRSSNVTRFDIVSEEIDGLNEQLNNADSEEFICPSCKSQVSKTHINDEILVRKEKLIKIREERGGIEERAKENAETRKKGDEQLKKVKELLAKENVWKLAKQGYDSAQVILSTINDDRKLANEELEGVISDIDSSDKKVVRYHNKIIEIKEEFDKKSEEDRKKIAECREVYAKLKEESSGIVDRISEIKKIIETDTQATSHFNSQIGAIEKDIENIKRLKEQNSETAKEIEEKNKSLSQLLTLETIYGLEGIQTRIIKKYIPLLNVYIKEFLDILSNGEMGVELCINEKNKIDMNIRGNTGDSYNMLSGGEKELARLATSIGLALLSFSRNSSAPEIICLDEIFGSLDVDRTNAVFRLLTTLKERFKRVVVISHNPEINDHMPHNVLIEKTSGEFGRSQIRQIS